MAKKRKSQPNTKAGTKTANPGAPRPKAKAQSALSKCSKAGVAYIKCNTCPFDFSSTDFVGIPDEYAGRTIAKKHQKVTAAPAMTTGNDYYFVILPIPGIAYATGSRATGTVGAMTITNVIYDDALTLFPNAAEGTNVVGARHASNVFELINTTNEMTWGGSIQVTKGFVEEVVVGDGTTSAAYIALNGLATACNSTKPNAVLPSKEGVFVTAHTVNSDNDFTSIHSKVSYANLNSNTTGSSSIENITLAGSGSVNYTGLSKMETIVVKVVNPPTGSTFIVRTEACVEYQTNPSSILYEYSHFSPGYDPTALALLAAFRKSHPAAVPFKDNARFWDEVLRWARSISAALKVLPGPAGAVSSGVNTILEAF
jgi:hypothetical protein